MTGSAWQLVRATRGPLLLMAFGTLMALNHTDKIGFDRTWPVLLILYGLSKLVERAVARPAPPPSWPPAPPFPPSAPPPSAPVPPGQTTEYPRYTPPTSGYTQGGAQ